MNEALILFAHGSRDAGWRTPFEQLRAEVATKAPQLRVELAFLEIMTPPLPDVIDACVRSGIHRIVVAPIFLAQGGHVKHDLPKMIEAAQQAHPQLQVRLLPAIGEVASLISAMADWLLHARLN